MPGFLQPILKTSRYTLYQVDSGGYAQLAAVTMARSIAGQPELLTANQDWMKDRNASAGGFTAYSYPGGSPDPALITDPAGAANGTVKQERVAPQRLEVRVENANPATLVLKVTYHPGWHVTVDGREQRTFMVSPSYIGVQLPPGQHQVRAEYRSSRLKNGLLVLGCCTLLAGVIFRRPITRTLNKMDALLSESRGTTPG